MFATRPGGLCVCVCRPVALVPYPSFLPHILPLFLPRKHIAHRDRLITRSLHWINRMSSDQGGRNYVLAKPSMSPHKVLVIAEVKEAQAPVPASPPSTPRAHCVTPAATIECSLFKGEDVSDRADSVYRGRRHGSSLVLHLAVPVLPPWGQLVSHLFLAHDVLECCLFATFFVSSCSLISDVATVGVLQLNLSPTSSSLVFVYSIASSPIQNFSHPTPYNLLSAFWYLLIHTSIP